MPESAFTRRAAVDSAARRFQLVLCPPTLT